MKKLNLLLTIIMAMIMSFGIMSCSSEDDSSVGQSINNSNNSNNSNNTSNTQDNETNQDTDNDQEEDKALGTEENNGTSMESSHDRTQTFQYSEDTSIPLCFTAEESNSVVKLFAIDWHFETLNIQYSKDNKNWIDYTESQQEIILANKGDKVYFRGDNPNGFNSLNKYAKFRFEGKVAASGNIMSLVNPSFSTQTIPNDYCFAHVFDGGKGLTTPPALPATILKAHCYDKMFNECTNLKYAPKFHGTQLAEFCCYEMFQNCTSLTYAPDFDNIALVPNCFNAMFIGCTALVNAPALMSKTLSESCYANIFKNCNNLNNITIAASNWGEQSTFYWVSGVASSGTFVCPENLASINGVSNIPEGWIVKTNNPTPNPPAIGTCCKLNKDKLQASVPYTEATKLVFDLKKNVNTSSLTATGKYVDEEENNLQVYRSGTEYYVLSECNGEIMAPENCESLFSTGDDDNPPAFKGIIFNSFNTLNVTDMSNMFKYCTSLTSLELTKFDTRNVTEMLAMFGHCLSLKTINVSQDFKYEQADVSDMFNDCPATGNYGPDNKLTNKNTEEPKTIISIISGVKESVEINENMILDCYIGTYVNLEVKINGVKYHTESNINYCTITLPTDKAGTFDVTVTLSADGYKTATKSYSYTVKAKAVVDKNLDYTINPSSGIGGTVYVDDDVYLNFSMSQYTDVKVLVNGKTHSTKTETKSCKIYLPTESAGSYNVSVTLSADGYKTVTESYSYTVKAKAVVDKNLDYTINPSSGIGGTVYVDDDVYLNFSMSQYTDVKVLVNGKTHSTKTETKSCKIYLPTESAGSYSVSVTLSANGYKTVTESYSYTVKAKAVVDKNLDYTINPSSGIGGTVYVDDDVYLYFSMSQYTDVKVMVNGKTHSTKTETKSCKIYLPTESAGSYSVSVTLSADGYKTVTESYSYTVKAKAVQPQPDDDVDDDYDDDYDDDDFINLDQDLSGKKQ